MLNVVHYAPRIPQNTGQIGRACFAAGAKLHLIRPLGFRVDDAALRRSSVGYLKEMDFKIHASLDAFAGSVADASRLWLVTKHGANDYSRVAYAPGDWIVMGNETEGLPPEWLASHPRQTVRIPMPNPQARCLNLATAAAVVLFEALRQIGRSNNPVVPGASEEEII